MRVPLTPWTPAALPLLLPQTNQSSQRCGWMAPAARSSVKRQVVSHARRATLLLAASHSRFITDACQQQVGASPAGTKAPRVFQPGRTRISRGGPPLATSPLVSGGSGGSQDWGGSEADAPPPGRRRSSAPGDSLAQPRAVSSTSFIICIMTHHSSRRHVHVAMSARTELIGRGSYGKQQVPPSPCTGTPLRSPCRQPLGGRWHPRP